MDEPDNSSGNKEPEDQEAIIVGDDEFGDADSGTVVKPVPSELSAKTPALKIKVRSDKKADDHALIKHAGDEDDGGSKQVVIISDVEKKLDDLVKEAKERANKSPKKSPEPINGGPPKANSSELIGQLKSELLQSQPNSNDVSEPGKKHHIEREEIQGQIDGILDDIEGLMKIVNGLCDVVSLLEKKVKKIKKEFS